jgi:3-(3-hydroxy-phenyl)propionate hydroxylase
MFDRTLYDVAIVGAGPTGSVTASLLAQGGLKVLVVDTSQEIYDKPRAISLDHEVMRVFQNLGLADQIAPFVEPFSASEHFGVDGQMIRRLAMLGAPYPMAWTPSMVFLQPPVEAVLRTHLKRQPYVNLQLGFKLLDISQSDQFCTLSLGNINTKDATQNVACRARYVVGCDGASSTVRRLAGIELLDLGFDEPWLVVDLQANSVGLEKLPKASAQYCEPARPASYLIGTGNHRRWEIMLLPGEDPLFMQTPEKVWSLLSRWIGPEDATLWRVASYRFHALVAKKWRAGPLFVAGDAAHQQPPFLGQGMCQGVRDAANLAWKLIQVIKLGADETLLNTYGEERGAHVQALTTTIKHIGAGICERDIEAARHRDKLLLEGVGGLVKTVPRQDLIPPLSTGFLGRQNHPANGTLFPQPFIFSDAGPVDSDRQRLDDLCASGWWIVLSARAVDWQWSQNLKNLVHALSIHKFCVASSPRLSSSGEPLLIECDSILDKWFVKYDCCVAIVRPDHYVYAVSDDLEDIEAVLTLLKLALKQ